MKLIWLVVILAIVVGGVVILSNQSRNDKDPLKEESSQSQLPAENSTGETPANKSTETKQGAYVDDSSSVIASTAGTKILFFHAPWCPQCRALETSIKSSQIPEGVTIIKVDYDTNQPLRKKYGVTIQTTLVRVDESGNLVKKYVAYDEPTLAAVKTNLL